MRARVVPRKWYFFYVLVYCVYKVIYLFISCCFSFLCAILCIFFKNFRYIFGSVNQQDLAAYYRDADVALVTPLRDGMNLVAKEFVACQTDDNPGVLILSPFAGAGGLNLWVAFSFFTEID